jgi:2-keto-4-pentenoate hydratase/2-oxohepta-3-ene-1,7-dioic acid hydratase in catechol pathway
MKIVRFQTATGDIQSGILHGTTIDVIEGDALGSLHPTGATAPLAAVKLLAPVVPKNLLCIGRNYREHAKEGGSDAPTAPILFLKATTTLNDPDGEIVLPREAPACIDFEAELAVVIGTAAKDVSESDALRHVLGYTCANDVTARDVQRNDAQWARGKSFDTFCPLGPWIETALDPANLRVRGKHNGVVQQDETTAQLIFSVPYLISWLSRSLTLVPGTVLLTGTPAGCGFAQKPPLWMKPGDVYEIEIEGIGTLRNTFVAAG